jgi:hypothetical protein
MAKIQWSDLSPEEQKQALKESAYTMQDIEDDPALADEVANEYVKNNPSTDAELQDSKDMQTMSNPEKGVGSADRRMLQREEELANEGLRRGIDTEEKFKNPATMRDAVRQDAQIELQGRNNRNMSIEDIVKQELMKGNKNPKTLEHVNAMQNREDEDF